MTKNKLLCGTKARPTSERQESCATEEYGKIPHDSSTLSIEQLSRAHIESELMLCKLCTHHTYVMRSTWLRPHPPESETDGTRQKIEVVQMVVLGSDDDDDYDFRTLFFSCT